MKIIKHNLVRDKYCSRLLYIKQGVLQSSKLLSNYVTPCIMSSTIIKLTPEAPSRTPMSNII